MIFKCPYTRFEALLEVPSLHCPVYPPHGPGRRHWVVLVSMDRQGNWSSRRPSGVLIRDQDQISGKRQVGLKVPCGLWCPTARSYGVSWAIKESEPWRADASKLWCWRRLLSVPWTARRSNQSILREINPEYSLEGLMLKLKLWYFGHLMRRTDSLEKTLMLGKIEGRRRGQRRWGGWMATLTQWRSVWANSGR